MEFKSIFTSVLDSIAPVKEVRLKQRSEPWLTSDILDLIKTRDMFLYECKTYNKSEFYKSFCLYRNMVQREVKTAKADYLSYKMEGNKNNPRNLWQQIKSLGYIDKTRSSPSIVLNIDDQNCYDNNKIADYFNSFLLLRWPQCWFRNFLPARTCFP